MVGIALVAALTALGCAEGRYRAANLPRELAAPATVNVQAIDLSRLGSPPVDSDRIERGDVLEVTMVTDYAKLTAATTPVRVADDGSIGVPLIGKVAVAGLRPEEAEQAVISAAQLRGVFLNPAVTVTMKEQRTNKITVVGAVNKPGVHPLPRASSSLLAALVAAEGLSKEAGPEVEVRHSVLHPVSPQAAPRHLAQKDAEGRLVANDEPQADASIIKVDLASSSDGKITQQLSDGDVVYVSKRSLKGIYVLGLVAKPGEYEYPLNHEVHVLDALALAGGATSAVADKVIVIRQLPGQASPANIAVSINAAKSGGDNLKLAPGDTVLVERTAETIVLDSIQTFFRVGFSAALPMF